MGRRVGRQWGEEWGGQPKIYYKSLSYNFSGNACKIEEIDQDRERINSVTILQC